jgi:uncharacterized protein YbjT (DUF2867 family)
VLSVQGPQWGWWKASRQTGPVTRPPLIFAAPDRAPPRQTTQGEPESLRAPGDEPLVVPEDVGRAAAQLLLDEVSRGGVVDGAHQGLLLLLAALGPEEASQVRLGPLTPHAVRTLRLVREFFGVVFDMRTDSASGTITLTCVGCGLKNLNRKIT